MAERPGTLALEPKLRPIRFQLSFNLALLEAGRGPCTVARPAQMLTKQTVWTDRHRQSMLLFFDLVGCTGPSHARS